MSAMSGGTRPMLDVRSGYTYWVVSWVLPRCAHKEGRCTTILTTTGDLIAEPHPS